MCNVGLAFLVMVVLVYLCYINLGCTISISHEVLELRHDGLGFFMEITRSFYIKFGKHIAVLYMVASRPQACSRQTLSELAFVSLVTSGDK